jgi:hypothetical protein
MKLNICSDCGRRLERKDSETDSIVIEAGDVACCCGSIDENGNYYDALCIDCCDSVCNGSQIWEGKGAGGGYYIVNPSF